MLVIAAAVAGAIPFIRQDTLFYAACFLIFGLGWVIRKNAGYPRKAVFQSLLLISAIGVSYGACEVFFNGTPYTVDRTLNTFLDHYFYANRALFPDPLNEDRTNITLRYFGNPQTLSEVLLKNFVRLLPYFGHKLILTLEVLIETFWIPFLGCLGFWLLHERNRGCRKRPLPARSIIGILILISSLKALLIGILVNPMERYYLDFFVFFMVFVALECEWAIGTSLLWRRALSILFAGMLIFSDSSLFAGGLCMIFLPSAQVSEDSGWASHEKIRAALIKEGIRPESAKYFEAGTIMTHFSYHPGNGTLFAFADLAAADRAKGFDAFLRSRDYEVIILNEITRSVAAEMAIDGALADFEKNFQSLGYRRIRIHDYKTEIYLRDAGAVFKSRSGQTRD